MDFDLEKDSDDSGAEEEENDDEGDPEQIAEFVEGSSGQGSRSRSASREV